MTTQCRINPFFVFILISLAPHVAQAQTSWLFVSLIQDKRIVAYERQPDSGRLIRRSQTDLPAEPGVLLASPDRKTLFVALRSTGELASYRIDATTGKLTSISVVPGGADPCYFAVDQQGHYLLTAYYVANQVTVHKLAADGTISERPLQVIPTAKNAHAIELDKTNRMTFVPHTGANQIFQFRFAPDSGRLSASSPASITLTPGDEPRHVAIHPGGRWVYANNEAGDGLNFFEIAPTAATLRHRQTLPTLPANFDGAQNATARCEMTRDGRFIYVANRGHNSLAAFAIDSKSGRLRSLGQTPTETTPRSFSISPDMRFLYAAGQGSGKIAQYSIGSDGTLDRRATYDPGPKPWCVLAIDIPTD